MRSFLFVGFALSMMCAGLPATAFSTTLLEQAIEDYNFQDYDVAREKFEEVLATEPNNISAHYYLGVLFKHQGALDKAIEHLEIVAAVSPKPEGVDKALAEAYMAAKAYEKGLPFYRQQYQSNPDNEVDALQYGKALQQSGEDDMAVEVYQALIEGGGKYADPARYQLGQIYSTKQAYVTAVELFRAIDPTSPFGGVASSYIDALSPMTRPVSFYLSGEYFHNTNPSSTSASLINQGDTGSASNGATIMGSVSSRGMEIGDRFTGKLSYLYYGTFYSDEEAKTNDFYGHFFNPMLSYLPSNRLKIDLKGDVQIFNYNRQKLSDNLGATLTATWKLDHGRSINVSGSYLNKRYSTTYQADAETNISLAYLDAANISVGVGTVLAMQGWNGSLKLGYKFGDERVSNEGDIELGSKASDSRYREHAIRADASQSFSGMFSRLTLMANLGLTYKNYLNEQSGQTYPDAAGELVNARTLSAGVRLQGLIWKAAALNLAMGAERTRSYSTADSLDYVSNRYFAQLTSSF
ncbi:MAG: tetratricopeptide repeat protein [Mariprofundaceae bacterium]